MARKPLIALGLAAVLVCAELGASADEDILGPIGPYPAPTAGQRPSRKIMAAALAVGFGALAVYFTRRRRRRPRPAAQVAPETLLLPGDDLLNLSDADLYAELLRLSREAIGDANGAPASALTPGELARLDDPRLHVGDWAGLFERAAGVLYARGQAAPEQREADLRLVQGLFGQDGGGRDGV